jgi:hypothetical protein
MNKKRLVLVLRGEHNEPCFVENQNRITIQIYFQLTVEWHLSSSLGGNHGFANMASQDFHSADFPSEN